MKYPYYHHYYYLKTMQGNFPHGCNPDFTYGYCNAGGGCSYTSEFSSNPNWCCFKGCTVSIAPQVTTTAASISTVTTSSTSTTSKAPTGCSMVIK